MEGMERLLPKWSFGWLAFGWCCGSSLVKLREKLMHKISKLLVDPDLFDDQKSRDLVRKLSTKLAGINLTLRQTKDSDA
jgi:methyl coenzyme M reductase gamma subunit